MTENHQTETWIDRCSEDVWQFALLLRSGKKVHFSTLDEIVNIAGEKWLKLNCSDVNPIDSGEYITPPFAERPFMWIKYEEVVGFWELAYT